ncbi:MAG: lipopolysaccharide heptosyltransferase I [Thiotrichales bacterium]|nr:lipopolysaccharide heptosyltransferase I [Thiotrichales bacterium]
MQAPITKILIVRLSAMGDIVMATPLLSALKAEYPGVEISWMVQPEFADVIRNHPLIDEIILVPKGQWKKDLKAFKWLNVWREIRTIKKQIQDSQFDLAIDLQGLIKSALWVKWSKAPRKIGLNSKEGTAKWMDEVVQGNVVASALIGSEYQAMAQHLNCDVSSFCMQLPTELNTPNLSALQAEVAGEYVVFCPFTTRPQKHWFDDAWQELANKVSANQKVVILGGPGDVQAAQQLMQNMPPNVYNLVGRTRIQEAIAFIRNAQGVIGVDTGLTHMGIAENKPTLALFGSTLPYRDTRTPLAKVLYHKLECSPCRRNPTCEGRFDCMRALTPEYVFDEWQLLQAAQ